MESKDVKCPNCESAYDKDYAFCPHCGQKSNDELTLGVLFYNTISNYFSFDARFFKSFIPLIIKPGFLAAKFLEGKRLVYLHPAQMYLFISVIFFFIISFNVRDVSNKVDEKFRDDFTEERLKEKTNAVSQLDSSQIEKIMKPLKDNQSKFGLKDEDIKVADSILKAESVITFNNNDEDIPGSSLNFGGEKIDSLIKVGADDKIVLTEMGLKEDAGFFERKMYLQALKFLKERGVGSIIRTFFDTIPISLFFLLPLFAFILKIFYFNKGTYSHHLVFSFYFFSFMFALLSIVFGLNRIWDIPDWIDSLVVLFIFWYFFLALKHFYKQHWFLTLFKSGIITFIFTLMVLPFAFVLVGIFAFLYY